MSFQSVISITTLLIWSKSRNKNVCQFLSRTDVHNVSSDAIEPVFGVTKARRSDNKLAGVTPIILMMPLRLCFADKTRQVELNFKERLRLGRHRHIKEWTEANLSQNLVVRRRETIGKKRVGF